MRRRPSTADRVTVRAVGRAFAEEVRRRRIDMLKQHPVTSPPQTDPTPPEEENRR